MKFCSRVFDMELPLDAFLLDVALLCPGHDFLPYFVNRTLSTTIGILDCRCSPFVFWKYTSSERTQSVFPLFADHSDKMCISQFYQI